MALNCDELMVQVMITIAVRMSLGGGQFQNIYRRYGICKIT